MNKKDKKPKVKKEKAEVEEKPKKKKGRKRHKHYVNPKEFQDQILTFYDTGVISKELGEAVFNIANRLGYAPNFINYTYKEDMIGDALIKMFAALNNKKFDMNKGNPFSYFTKIAYNAYRNRIKKEKKARQVLLDYQDEVYTTLTDLGQLPDTTHNTMHNDDYDV